MVNIDSTEFGSIVIDGKTYESDVIVSYAGKIKEVRSESRHLISQKEFLEMIFERPEIIVIGTGVSGLMKISPEVLRFAKEKNVKIVSMLTSQAIEKFNQLVQAGEKVVAYMHVTC